MLKQNSYEIVFFRKIGLFRKNTFLKESILKTPKSIGALGISNNDRSTKISEKLSELSCQNQKCVFFA